MLQYLVAEYPRKCLAVNHQHCSLDNPAPIVNGLADSSRILDVADLNYVLLPRFESGRDGDAFCCLDLITRQHPNLNASLSKSFYCPKNTLLQLVLYPGHSQEIHVALEAFNGCLHFGFAVYKFASRLLESLLEVLILSI